MVKGHQLFIPKKDARTAHQPTYGTDMRAIEQWGNALPTSGGGALMRTARYRVQATTHRSLYLHGNKFTWTGATITTLFKSGALAPRLDCFVATPTTGLVMEGIPAAGTAPIVMVASYILYVVLKAPVARAAVNLYRINWTFTRTAPVTVPKLIRDTIVWPATTAAPITVWRSYNGNLVNTKRPTATWTFSPITVFTGITQTTTIALTVGTSIYALFTVVLMQGEKT